MALVLTGGGVINISGSIAGNTFARNRSGLYVRSRTKPVNPNTGLQVAVKAAMAFIVERWAQTLTAVQRAAWNLYASNVAMKNRLGQTINLTGFNHYIRSNVIRKMTAQAVIDAGPVVFELPEQDPTLTITATEAAQTIDFAIDAALPWALETGGLMFEFQGIPQNAQRNFFGGPWRLCGVLVGVDPGGPASPHTRPVQYPIAELQHQWAYCRISRADGRLSEPFYDDAFTAA